MTGLVRYPDKIWLVVEPVDLRRGIDGLSLHIQHVLEKSVTGGNAFVFRNRRGNRVKVILWDGNGVWLCQRRLHQGRLVWPKSDEDSLTLTQAEWRWLITGVDWQRLSAMPPAHLQA